MLLTREQFRNGTFKRDDFRCVVCGDGQHNGFKIDAHHIIERRLWDDGGYYLDNGATLCDKGNAGCHFKAETGELTVEDVRLAAKITNIEIPPDMYGDHVYDKWGNVVMPDGRRTKGPLYNDESVRKILDKVEWVEWVKYPRTYHLPWSHGVTDDDRVLKDISCFKGKRVIVTEKMDGENFTGYRNYCHARSVDGKSHYTRNWAKSFWAHRSYELPEGMRVVAENLYAKHSIGYDNLPGYLMGISVWEGLTCLGWDDTVEWFGLLDMPVVPVLYDGVFDETEIRKLWNEKSRESSEGYVCRNADAFQYNDFARNVGKFVRKNHVTSNVHWFYGKNDHEINGLKG